MKARQTAGNGTLSCTSTHSARFFRSCAKLPSLLFMSSSLVHVVILSFLSLLFLTVLSSCGGKNGHFRIEGRFRSFNRGEFYIYNANGNTVDVDTIKVADGRFAYEIPLERTTTFVIIFPNFSELAVFGEPGAIAKIKGDASHLREMEVSGTEDNKLMTNFRLNANKMSPPEVKEAAVEFVKENPASPVSLYLINRYLILSRNPDYARAYELAVMMRRTDPENADLLRMVNRLEALRGAPVGGKLPAFTATDTGGKRVSRTQLKGRVNVISAWATWSYESQNMQRRLRALQKKYGGDMAVVSICLDARKGDCERQLKRDSIGWPNVCDGRMWKTPLLRTTGIATVPGNIIADKDGRIVARNVDGQQLEDRIKAMLK